MALPGVIYYGRLSLFDGADIVNNPTIAAGDVVVVKADGTVANITTLPTVNAADTDIVEYTLSVAEMAGSATETVTVKFEDQAGAEWDPVVIDILLDQDVLAAIAAALASILAAVNAVCACVLSGLHKIPAVKKSLRTADLWLYRGDTWIQDITLGVDITTATEIWFTVKRDKDLADTAADIKVSSVDGLEYINQTTPTAAGNGILTVLDATTGEIRVRIEAVETAKLIITDGQWYWDAQWTDGTDDETPKRGRFTVTGDSTRET
jgi:hypothetical protein